LCNGDGSKPSLKPDQFFYFNENDKNQRFLKLQRIKLKIRYEVPLNLLLKKHSNQNGNQEPNNISFYHMLWATNQICDYGS
jgi:hypothetical protein